MTMNIWLVCQYYKPETGAPSARLSGFAHVWQRYGVGVDVLTAVPNHPDGVIPETYQGKARFLKTFMEQIDGVSVHRHWLYVTPNKGFLKKTLSHLTFAASVLWGNLMRGNKQKPDVIVASSPAFFAAVSAWLLSVRYRVPFVMEVRDLWPGIFVELGVLKKGLLLKVLEWVELFLYRRAAAVVTVTRGFAEDIKNRGISPKKLYVITNGVADTELDAALSFDKEDEVGALRSELQIPVLTKVVLYIGAHGRSQALGQIVEAARLTMNRSDILYLFVGDGEDKGTLQKMAAGMPNIQFLGLQPKERVWLFYKLADVCLVPLRNIEGFKTFIPSKMFEIMAAGRALIGCVAGEAARIIEQSGAGLVVPPEDAARLSSAVTDLIDDEARQIALQKAGPVFVDAHYRHSQLAGQYLGLLQYASGKEPSEATLPPSESSPEPTKKAVNPKADARTDVETEAKASTPDAQPQERAAP